MRTKGFSALSWSLRFSCQATCDRLLCGCDIEFNRCLSSTCPRGCLLINGFLALFVKLISIQRTRGFLVTLKRMFGMWHNKFIASLPRLSRNFALFAEINNCLESLTRRLSQINFDEISRRRVALIINQPIKSLPRQSYGILMSSKCLLGKKRFSEGEKYSRAIHMRSDVSSRFMALSFLHFLLSLRNWFHLHKYFP